MITLRSTLKTAAVFALAGLSSIAMAQDRWYKVEVIIIEHRDKSALKLEEWPTDTSKPNLSNALSLNDESAKNAFYRLQDKDLELKDAKTNLQRQGSRILLHTSWAQNLGNNQKNPVRLSAGHQYGDDFELDGALTVSLSNYLHINNDFVLIKPVDVQEAESSYEHSESQRVRASNSANANMQAFRLKENMKIKKDEVFYVDHPLYGILVKVSNLKSSSNAS